MKEFDDFLREHKPIVKDDPCFILETRRRLDAVEGIKKEVDRQRSKGRTLLIIALATGMVLGVVAALIAYLCPVDVTAAGKGIWESIRAFLEARKPYLFLSVALTATLLTLAVFQKRTHHSAL